MSSSGSSSSNADGGKSAKAVTNRYEGYWAVAILVLTVLAVVVGAVYLRYNRRLWGLNESSWADMTSGTFTPPPERAAYLAAKSRLDPSKPAELEELRKLLMRRAIKAIPLLLKLQTDGTSIDRLYKRGMLTDDMHFKVKDLKAFVDEEFQDVQLEADDLQPGWSQSIWNQANTFHQMIQKRSAGDKEEKEDGEDEDELNTIDAVKVETPRLRQNQQQQQQQQQEQQQLRRQQQQQSSQPLQQEAAATREEEQAKQEKPKVETLHKKDKEQMAQAQELSPEQYAEKIARELLLEEEKEKKKKKKSQTGKK